MGSRGVEKRGRVDVSVWKHLRANCLHFGESRWYQDDFSEIWRLLRWNIFRPVLIESETLCFNLVFWFNRNEVCWPCGDNNNKCFMFYSVIFSSPHFLLIEHTARLSFCPRLICRSYASHPAYRSHQRGDRVSTLSLGRASTRWYAHPANHDIFRTLTTVDNRRYIEGVHQ